MAIDSKHVIYTNVDEFKQGIESLAPGQQVRSAWLQLIKQSLDDSAAQTISDMINHQNMCRYFWLNLSDSKVSAKQIRLITAAFSKETPIEFFAIDLVNSQVDDDMVLALVEFLQSEHRPKFIEVNLSHNQLSDDSIATLMNATKSEGVVIITGSSPQGTSEKTKMIANKKKRVASSFEGIPFYDFLATPISMKFIENELAQILKDEEIEPGTIFNFRNSMVTPAIFKMLADACDAGLIPDHVEFNFSNIYFDPKKTGQFVQLTHETYHHYLSERSGIRNKKIPEEYLTMVSHSDFDAEALLQLERILKSAKRAKQLRLRLNNCNLTPAQVHSLSQAIHESTSDKPLHLHLSKNIHRGFRVSAAISPILRASYPRYYCLDLSANYLGASGMKVLRDAIMMQKNKLAKPLQIILSHVAIAKSHEKKSAEYIAQMLTSGKCPDSFALDLSGNNFHGKSFEIILSALQSENCPKNLRLDFSDSKLTDKDIKTLCRVISSGHLPEKIKIDISDQSITHKGAEMFKATLERLDPSISAEFSFGFRPKRDYNARFFAPASETGTEICTFYILPKIDSPFRGLA